jgi:lipoprotein-anchoring transpeptidase ErfK/SrfK
LLARFTRAPAKGSVMAGKLGWMVIALSVGCGASAVAQDLRADLAWQIALERVGFSPGVIDGKVGHKTELATREFQRVRGLATTGKFDAATAAALGIDSDGAIATYVVHQDDAAEVGPAPTNWNDKSKLQRLGYESVASAVAEKFHCSRGLLARLNPGLSLQTLKPGDVLRVPSVSVSGPKSDGAFIQINLAEKVIRVLNGSRQLIALMHCSIAKDKEKLPVGPATVIVIRENPGYTFDPKMWPEVKDVNRKLLIPPGPRNPVGRCWVGLSLPGYGIHGTPNPEMIGKTGSHGCFRLTNWDAVRLSKIVRVGTKVEFVGHEAVADGTTPRRSRGAVKSTGR